MLRIQIFFCLAACLLASCSDDEKTGNTLTRFQLLDPARTGIRFNNQLEYTEALNTYTFRNFYNGGGVGIGDINNDGLPDVFLSGNLVSSRLYLNKGDLHFEDITERSGLAGEALWTTGVSLADVNNDGFLDIYLCKSGPPGGKRRHNELFINNGDLTFREMSREYGLGFEGLSTHAAFFDYDRDGDLDCYLLNNSFRPVGVFDLRPGQRNIPDPEGGNKLLRNDGQKFTDVTASAGIYSSAIGFGLGVTVGDVNQDGWPDLFISNDFFEKDYLYINNRDGSFREDLESCMREISMGSMGADMADINNDGFPEIYVTEMLPEHDDRLKTTSQFESYDRRMLSVKAGYYHQFSRNVLQYNNGNGTFSEISRLAGVHATDWSWGALIFDMDNDGWKDIFVANGIYKDLLDQDYVNFIATPEFIRQSIAEKEDVLRQLIDSIPSNKIANYAFHNKSDLTFANRASEWGLATPTHSNGSAYGDLDNDGDLDLVLNNVNMPAHVYENRTTSLEQNNFLTVSLRSKGENVFAVGAKVIVIAGGQKHYQELSPMRGFMSSVDYRLHFGLGDSNVADSVTVYWPDGKSTFLDSIPVNRIIEITDADAVQTRSIPATATPAIFTESSLRGLEFLHKENDFVDFDRDRLLFNMISNEGPCMCTGDINNDWLDDVYIGGAKGQAGSLFVQQRNGEFKRMFQSVFDSDRDSEDTDCVFFDANGDGRQDLYVASGGTEFSSSSFALVDRLYLQEKSGLVRSRQILPVKNRFESTSCVAAADFDKDGDHDLFVGIRLVPFNYGIPANGYVLRNDGLGVFDDVTDQIAPVLKKAGMFRDAHWADVNNDGAPDLITVGDWMGIRVFLQEAGKFSDRSDEFGLGNTSGWYNTVCVADVNNDMLPDIIAGNHGLNSRFRASVEEPVSLYVNDFDGNGALEHILTRFDRGTSYPLVLRQDLVSQIPSLKKKFLYFDDYKDKTISDIFTPDQLANAIVLQANTLETALWINRDGRRFDIKPLPLQAQIAPVYAIAADDFNGDHNMDLLLGGNQQRAKPETGIYDASYGTLLTGDGIGNFTAQPQLSAGLNIRGEIRSLRLIKTRTGKHVLVARNNLSLMTLKY